MKKIKQALLPRGLLALVVSSASGATATWLGATDATWEASGNWTPSVPTAADTAVWDTPSTANLNATLATPRSVAGLKVVDPSGPVGLSGSTLTIGANGIDMSTASQDLMISSNLSIPVGNQVWNVAAGRQLSLIAGTFTRPVGAAINVQGTGTVVTSMTGLSNDASGILGTWATVDNGANPRFATLSGSNALVGYTGATVVSTITAAWAGIPAGATATSNYDITVSGAAGIPGSSRTVNTIRYSGPGAYIQEGNNAATMTVGGILNAGGGTFTIGSATSTKALKIIVGGGGGSSMILNAATADIAILNVLQGGGTRGVTITGSHTVTFGGVNTYPGTTFVNDGTLVVNGTALLDSGTLAINGGRVQSTGNEVVSKLFFGASQQPAGTYGATGSGATHIDDVHFSGSSGMIIVTSGLFDAWASAKGLTVANNGPGADPDNDGVSNMLEFVLGGDPLAGATSIMPVCTGDNDSVILTFSRNDDSESEVPLNVQWSVDLNTWTDIPIGAVSSSGVDVQENSSASDAITVRVPKTHTVDGKLFVRLKATK